MGSIEQQDDASPEAIGALYEVLLGREPSTSDMAAWSGASVRDVGAAILTSAEYLARVVPSATGDSAPALRMLATDGLTDLGRSPAVAPSPALLAFPFDVAMGRPSAPIRVIGGYAEELATELRDRGSSQVVPGLSPPLESRSVLVLTGPNDLAVIAAVRPDIVAGSDRVISPRDENADEPEEDRDRGADQARAAIHELGFAEVARLFRFRHDAATVTIDISDLVPPEGFHEVRVVTDAQRPLSTWLIGNRVPCWEER